MRTRRAAAHAAAASIAAAAAASGSPEDPLSVLLDACREVDAREGSSDEEEGSKPKPKKPVSKEDAAKAIKAKRPAEPSAATPEPAAKKPKIVSQSPTTSSKPAEPSVPVNGFVDLSTQAATHTIPGPSTVAPQTQPSSFAPTPIAGPLPAHLPQMSMPPPMPLPNLPMVFPGLPPPPMVQMSGVMFPPAGMEAPPFFDYTQMDPSLFLDANGMHQVPQFQSFGPVAPYMQNGPPMGMQQHALPPQHMVNPPPPPPPSPPRQHPVQRHKKQKSSGYTVPDDDERRHPCTQPDCPLMFIRLEHAKRHSEICGKSLHVTKQVPCPVCGTLFTREDNMKIHAKTKHKIVFPPKRERRLSEYS